MSTNSVVVHVSTSDIAGGAARCAYRLHQGLLGIGWDSRMFVSRRRSSDPTVVGFRPSVDASARIRARIRRTWLGMARSPYGFTRPPGYERFSDDRSVVGGETLAKLPSCDLVNLHWVAGFVDYGSFFGNLPATLPAVWTLHDMNVFTGGCHYNDGCRRFEDRCGNCPQLGSNRPLDLSWQVWRRKHTLFTSVERSRLHIVTPTQWLAREARRSSVLGDRFSISVIPYGVDTNVFAPRDAAASRDALGIARDARVLLFAAERLDNRRKGMALLAGALSGLSDVTDLCLLTLGDREDSSLGGRIAVRNLGHVKNDRLLSLVYSAADLLVLPSLQDNLPATALEALACGLPVAGFDIGGVPEAVRPGITGALAATTDASALANVIEQLLHQPQRLAELKANCRRIAVQEYGLETQAHAYAELYADLLASGTPEPLAREREIAPLELLPRSSRELLPAAPQSEASIHRDYLE